VFCAAAHDGVAFPMAQLATLLDAAGRSEMCSLPNSTPRAYRLR